MSMPADVYTHGHQKGWALAAGFASVIASSSTWTYAEPDAFFCALHGEILAR